MKKTVRIDNSNASYPAYRGLLEVIPEVPELGDIFDRIWTVSDIEDAGLFTPTTDSNTLYRHYILLLTDINADYDDPMPTSDERHVAVLEEECPDIEDFVRGLFNDSVDCPPQPMTIDQAEDDLRRFNRAGWILPNDITPDNYMDIWNDLVTEDKINRNWGAIVNLMDDTTREIVHAELAPCSNVEFLNRYLELDPAFSWALKNEFSIDADPGLSWRAWEAADTAKKIRALDFWDADLCRKLVKLADMEDEYDACTPEEAEGIIRAAAEKLEVII